MNSDLPLLSRQIVGSTLPTERVLQFGTGNFLKGFVNAAIEQMNQLNRFDAAVIAIKLRPGNHTQIERVNAQEGLFTLNVRGVEGGEIVDRCELVHCQSRAINPYLDVDMFWNTASLDSIRWVVSNATEAGIFFDAEASFNDSPAVSFPAKFTQWLYKRWQYFEGSENSGVGVICCELVEDNADKLRHVILQHIRVWELSAEFGRWFEDNCRFYNSLVDRIVPGRPPEEACDELQKQLGYTDHELLETEPYMLWAIQVPSQEQSGFQESFPCLNVNGLTITHDLDVYRERKVRLLNGPHTATANLARLMDVKTVYQATKNVRLNHFIQALMQEDILPLLPGDPTEMAAYARDIYQRFTNPFLNHEWRTISMNSISKWRARLLPLVKRAALDGEIPARLIASMVCLLAVYRDPALVNDGDYHSELFEGASVAQITTILATEALWGEDLNLIEGFGDAVKQGFEWVLSKGVCSYLESIS
jgi:tagaturonate reductase